MNLAVITLIRNEADIFPAFARHVACLFDTALFLDHFSTDGTTAMIEQACAAFPAWQHWTVTIPGYHQSVFTTFALRHLFATTPADAVFILDADEFLDFPSRQTLEALLATPRDPRCVPALAWRNTVPHPLTGTPLGFGDTCLVAATPSPFTKIIVRRETFTATGGALTPLAGNHVADPGDGIPLTSEIIGTVLHIPLRSMTQLKRKTLTTALAHLARTDRPAHEGSHCLSALAQIAAGTLNEANLLGWAANYGEHNAHAQLASAEDLLHRGFLVRTLDVPHTASICAPPATPQTVEAALAAALLAWQPAASANITLELDGRTLRAVQPPPPARRDISVADIVRPAANPPRANRSLRRAIGHAADMLMHRLRGAAR